MITINTDYKGEIPFTNDIEKTLRKISEAGFTYVHWCHEWEGNYLYCTSEMQQIKEWFDKYNLKAKGIHASEGAARPQKNGKYQYRNDYDNRKDYTSENEYNRIAGVELIKNRVDLAHVLGTKEIVLHMQLPWKSIEESEEFKNKYYEQVFKSFDELEPYCKEKNVRIAVENLLGTPFKYQKEQFDKILKRYHKNFVGFCFDSGHGLIMSEDNPLQLVERYKDRLIALHLNDNLGATPKHLNNDLTTSKQDLHMRPFEGLLDWDRLIKIIAESAYELPLIMELSCKKETEEEFLKKSFEAGKKLNKLLEKYYESNSFDKIG
jgi:sugar phosphate isomerase/epimerase